MCAAAALCGCVVCMRARGVCGCACAGACMCGVCIACTRAAGVFVRGCMPLCGKRYLLCGIMGTSDKVCRMDVRFHGMTIANGGFFELFLISFFEV